MHLVHLKFSQNPYEGSSWWASLNCVLAIAHRLRVMSNLVPQEEDQKAWGFMKNALGVLAELTMRNTDLLSVQALLGMVSYGFLTAHSPSLTKCIGFVLAWNAKPTAIVSLGRCRDSLGACYWSSQERLDLQPEPRRD